MNCFSIPGRIYNVRSESFSFKIGVVLLIFAGLFAGAWIRNIVVSDDIRIRVDGNSVMGFHSSHGCLGWFWALEGLVNPNEKGKPDNSGYLVLMGPELNFEWETTFAFSSGGQAFIDDTPGTRKWGSFHITCDSLDAGGQWSISMPHWYVFIPLTLLAMWLLTSKTRASMAAKKPNADAASVN